MNKIIKIDGKKIKELRKSQGLTQSELADNLNISRVQLNTMENGNSNTKEDTLNKIIIFFNKTRIKNGFKIKRIKPLNKKYFLK